MNLRRNENDPRFLHADNLLIFRRCPIRVLVALFGKSENFVETAALAVANQHGWDVKRVTEYFLARSWTNPLKTAEALAFLYNHEHLKLDNYAFAAQIAPPLAVKFVQVLSQSRVFSLLSEDVPLPVTHAENLVLKIAIDTNDSALNIILKAALRGLGVGGMPSAIRARVDIIAKHFSACVAGVENAIISRDLRNLTENVSPVLSDILNEYEHDEVDDEDECSGRWSLQSSAVWRAQQFGIDHLAVTGQRTNDDDDHESPVLLPCSPSTTKSTCDDQADECVSLDLSHILNEWTNNNNTEMGHTTCGQDDHHGSPVLFPYSPTPKRSCEDDNEDRSDTLDVLNEWTHPISSDHDNDEDDHISPVLIPHYSTSTTNCEEQSDECESLDLCNDNNKEDVTEIGGRLDLRKELRDLEESNYERTRLWRAQAERGAELAIQTFERQNAQISMLESSVASLQNAVAKFEQSRIAAESFRTENARTTALVHAQLASQSHRLQTLFDRTQFAAEESAKTRKMVRTQAAAISELTAEQAVTNKRSLDQQDVMMSFTEMLGTTTTIVTRTSNEVTQLKKRARTVDMRLDSVDERLEECRMRERNRDPVVEAHLAVQLDVINDNRILELLTVAHPEMSNYQFNIGQLQRTRYKLLSKLAKAHPTVFTKETAAHNSHWQLPRAKWDAFVACFIVTIPDSVDEPLKFSHDARAFA